MKITIRQLRRLIVEVMTSDPRDPRFVDFPFKEYLADPKYKGMESDPKISNFDVEDLAKYLSVYHRTTLYPIWRDTPHDERITKFGLTKSDFEAAVEDTLLSDERLRHKFAYNKSNLAGSFDEISKKLNKIFERTPKAAPPLPRR